MIGIASDHAGFKVKEEIYNFLIEKGFDVINYGTVSTESVDYSDYAIKIGEAVKDKEIETGILVCSTGTGMSIACNKVKGVRCAKVWSKEEAVLAKEHNNANVLAMGSNLGLEKCIDITEAFLNTNFSNAERHIRRVEKIMNYEN